MAARPANETMSELFEVQQGKFEVSLGFDSRGFNPENCKTIKLQQRPTAMHIRKLPALQRFQGVIRM
jgi:hypothetical protein